MAIQSETSAPTASPPPVRRGRRRRGGPEQVNWPVTGVLAICSLSVLIPLYFVVVMALKTPAQTGSGSGFGWPSSLHFSNFSTAWNLVNAPRALTVSILISLVTVVGELALSSAAAWAIVRNWHHRVFRYSFFYLLAAMFIPFPVIALPQIKLTALTHLDNPVGVAILHIMFALAFNVLLYSAFVRTIPVELEESARMDGCTPFQVFYRIVLPLLAPMNATVGIFAFLGSWNDFMMPSLITANSKDQTLPVVQNIFQSTLSVNYNVAFASYFIAIVPAVLGYLFAQRWVISGVMRGAIK